MPRSTVEAGRAGFGERDDADAWAGHAARQGPATEYGLGEMQDGPGKSMRRNVGMLFFVAGYGLMLWMMGYMGVEPEGDTHEIVLAGCIAAYSVFGLILVWQIKRGEIFIRTELTGDQEGVVCGIKWSAFLGYIFLLVTLVVITSLPFWISQSIVDCMKKPANTETQQKERVQCLKDASSAIGFAFSGVFAGLAVALGLREILKHWLNYYKPMQQRQVVRALWMVPIYSVDAFWTLYLCFGASIFHARPIADPLFDPSRDPVLDSSGEMSAHRPAYPGRIAGGLLGQPHAAVR